MKKAYSIQMMGTNDANLDLYGEVVTDRPTDWYTGQPTEDAYIVASELLADLDDIKTKDNITIHINSVGGDLYAGLAIYNRLKSLPANITTINDGLAASAASLIFQAGDVRKVHPGSNLMVHQAMGFLWGYYQLNDLNQVSKQLKAANQSAINVYSEASGRDKDEIKRMVDNETWLTGEAAVEAGLADEVISESDDISMSLTADGKHLVVNGVQLSTKGMHNIPAGLPIAPANVLRSNAENSAVDKNFIEGGKSMEIKNIDELRNAYPELTEQVRAEAFDAGKVEGVAAERQRLKDISDIAKNIQNEQMVKDAMYGECPMTAEQLSYKAMKELDLTGATAIQNMMADTAESGVNAVAAVPVQPEMTEAEKQAEQVRADMAFVLDKLYPKEAK